MYSLPYSNPKPSAGNHEKKFPEGANMNLSGNNLCLWRVFNDLFDPPKTESRECQDQRVEFIESCNPPSIGRAEQCDRIGAMRKCILCCSRSSRSWFVQSGRVDLSREYQTCNVCFLLSFNIHGSWKRRGD
jgi:hypothetical protein